MPSSLPHKVASLEHQLAQVKKGQRLAHGASIENAAIEVKDDSGSLRSIVGVQGDGTVGVQAVNGPPPPQPTIPIVTSVIGGVAASWDGQFAGGAVIPLDWSRIEVHASTVADYIPIPETLRSTIETAQGATVVIPTDDPVYVRLVARNTSGTASPTSDVVGPFGRAPVVGQDILDGSITTLKLAEEAVTAAKIAAGAVGTVALGDGAVLDAKLADNAVKVGKIATDAVTAPAIAANAVTAVKINAGAVTAAKIAAGAVTTDKLTVTGGASILTDPSFEGAYTAAIIAGSTFATQDTTSGNGSPTSLKIDATSVTPAYRSVPLTSVATLPGEKWYLAVDYWVSADWAGTELSIHARWETPAGAVVSYSKVVVTSPVRGAWTRIEGEVTAPATTARIVPRVESGNATAGFIRFDNASVRPVLGGTQIQDGAVTTQKVVAGAIQTAQLAAGAVVADKIASAAVTTAKLDALSVTADKLAVNSVTADKILAGSVDTVALSATAINGMTITGAVIQTAASGARVTLNEAGANKVLVYDASGTAIGELSDRGLLLAGASGAVAFLDPDAQYPNLSFTNAAQTNSAYLQVVEPIVGDASLELLGGEFTEDTRLHMRSRLLLGSTSIVLDRVKALEGTAPAYGGRILLNGSLFSAHFVNADDTSQNANLNVAANLVYTGNSRFSVSAPASSNSACYVEAASAHTGNLLRLFRDTDKLTVDTNGNTAVAGILSAGNVAVGRIGISAGGGVPVSGSVSGLNLKGTNIRVVATASTSVPGTVVTGVGVNGQSATGFTVWITRTGTTTTTNIDWIAYGV